MSIKTIEKPMQGSAGIAKKINKGAEKMVFDILQSTQYSMPVQSTIRELVTNACDSQREKEIAIEIINGSKKVEDYYIERHGAQYEDSNFDKSYYNNNHLNFDDNEIQICYEKKKGVGFCDTFYVTDSGVGIGGRRLEGILELGYSTKRNTSENFGAFGLGAKAALSTGIDFYTIETVHNGMRFKCNCYNYKTDFIIPAYNIEKDEGNPHIVFSDGTKVYYEESDRTNFTCVSFGVKRHNRDKFEEAIEEQLMYFDNVVFDIIDIEGHEDDPDYRPLNKRVNFQAEVLHNSKNIIVSNSYYFNKPHIVLVKDENASTGINYGYIDFRELEMEQMYGSVAFKCPTRQVITNDDGTETVLQDGVDVTPSREKVIWNEATKKYIKGVIMAAAEEASTIIEAELQETDFLKWVDACRSIITGNSSENRILNKLARIINTDDMQPKYSLNKNIKYGPANKLFEGLSIMKPFEDRHGEGVKRESIKDWNGFDAKHFYKRDDSFSKVKDLYLMDKDTEDGYHQNHVTTYTIQDLDSIYDSKIAAAGGDAQAKLVKEKARVLRKRTTILKLIETSEWYKSYEDEEVPDEWLANYKEEEAQEKEKAKYTNLSAAERREIEKRMVAYTVRYDDRKEDHFTMDKIEPKTIDLMNSKYRTYYCTKEDEGKMKQAALLLKESQPSHYNVYPESNVSNWDKDYKWPVFWFDNPPVRFMKWSQEEYEDWAKPVQGWEHPQLIRVSQNKVKFITKNPNVKHIDELFLQLTTNNGYIMDESLVKYYTAHKLNKIKQFKFMQGLGCIHEQLQKDYCELKDLRDDHYSEFNHRQVRDVAPAITEHMDKLYDFQKFCNECDDAEMIQDKSRELFVLSDISEARAADLDILAKYDNVVEFAEEIKPLLDEIELLNERECNMSPELEKELRIYLRAKSRETWDEH